MNPRSQFIWRMIAIVIAVNLLFLGLAWFALRESRNQYENRAEITTQNLSFALTEHIADEIDKIDLVVRTVADEVERQLASGGINDLILNAFISRHYARLPVLDGLRVVNAKGENSYGIAITPGVRTSVADRSYFIRLRNDPQAGLVISEPVVGRVSKKWSIIFARRVNKADGAFAGLVYGTIALDYFKNMFSSINVGARGVIALRNDDLALIARYPESQEISQIVGKKNASPEFEHAVRIGNALSTYRTKQNLEGIQRTYSYRKTPRYPFYVVVGVAYDDYLYSWQKDAGAVFLLVVLFILVTVFSSWLVYRDWMRRAATLVALARQEEALRESEKEYRELFESSSDALFLIASETGQITEANQTAAALYGYTREELSGKKSAELSAEPEETNRRVQEAMMTPGQVFHIPFRRHRKKDGTVFPVDISARSFARKQGTVLLVSCRDITERKRSEDERAQLEDQNRKLQKSESLGRMAKAIAHHFNNQFHAVMMNLEMAQEEIPANAKASAEFLSGAIKSVHKAAEVSSLMLTYLGHTPSKLELLDLSASCTRSLPMLQAVMPKTAVLETQLPSPGPVIKGNSDQIQQVLTSLLTNAWEACSASEGIVRVTVKTVSLSDIPTKHRYPIDWNPQLDVSYACLEVADNGGGISAKDFLNLFDPFFSSKFAGRGMGLPAVLGIVRVHQGSIAVESELNRGSTFRVFFPLSRESLIPTKLPESLASTKSVMGTVLVVEDEPDVLSIAVHALKRLGFAVLTAGDGREGIEVFRQHQAEICCVLCDLTMPHMDGWATLVVLRKLVPGVPVILASGYSQDQVLQGEHSELPQAILTKPFNIQTLKNALVRALPNVTVE